MEHNFTDHFLAEAIEKQQDITESGETGNWTGTVAYLRFQAPSDGTNLIVVHFSGYQTTIKLMAPGELQRHIRQLIPIQEP